MVTCLCVVWEDRARGNSSCAFGNFSSANFRTLNLRVQKIIYLGLFISNFLKEFTILESKLHMLWAILKKLIKT